MALKPYSELKKVRIKKIRCTLCHKVAWDDIQDFKTVKVGGKSITVCAHHPVAVDEEGE